MPSKTELAARVLSFSAVRRLVRCTCAPAGLVVLAYHRIRQPNSGLDGDVISTTPERFDAQIRFLKKHFDVIGPADLSQIVRGRSGRHVMITFDDGYRDNYEQAFPILRAHRVGALFFITTGFIDRPRFAWWDEIAWMVRRSPRSGLSASPYLSEPLAFDPPLRRQAIRKLLRIYKALPGRGTEAYLDYLAEATGSGRSDPHEAADTWMTWDMLRWMKAGGMWIGGHTVNHPILSRLEVRQQEQEIAGCGLRLEEEIGQPMRWFSYPCGRPYAFTEETRACLKRQEVELAFSFYNGFCRYDAWDDYDVRRVAVELDTTQHAFEAALTLPQLFARPQVCT